MICTTLRWSQRMASFHAPHIDRLLIASSVSKPRPREVHTLHSTVKQSPECGSLLLTSLSIPFKLIPTQVSTLTHTRAVDGFDVTSWSAIHAIYILILAHSVRESSSFALALLPLQAARRRRGDTIESSSLPAIAENGLWRDYPLLWQDQLS